MRGIHAIAGLAVICLGLVSWAALAWAQPNTGKLPPVKSQPAEPVQAPKSGDPKVDELEPTPVGDPTDLPPVDNTISDKDPTPADNPLPGRDPMPLKAGAPRTQPMPANVKMPGKGASQEIMPGSHTKAADPEAIRPVGHVSEEPAPGPTRGNPTGRQEPAVALEWIGPITAKVGQPQEYTINVRNACNIAVQQVMVRVRIPKDMSVSATEPKAVSQENVLMWELGTLQPQAEKNLQLKMTADGRGDMVPQAWVTFTGSSVMRISVREPKLQLKATAPEKVLVGDAATIMLTVANPGDGPADQVKVHAVLSEGLENARGNKVDFEVGNLNPGESRSVQLICAAKAGGMQKCEAIAEAEGGLKSQDHADVNVIMPRIDLAVVGPKLRYLDRKAVYAFKVTNPGDAAATNVTVSDVVPAGFKFLSATDGGRHDFSTRTVSWFVGEVGPGQTKEVKMEVLAINPGEHRHKAVAQAARGLKTDIEYMTRVEGLSAILLEVVDTEDPIEVGADTAYEIRITNTGSKTETDIKVVATVPPQMAFKGVQGPCKAHEEGKQITFDPLSKLAPRADAIFRVNVKGVQPGDVRFKVQVTSTNLVEPVVEMEATRIYADEPEGK
ncbi:MAG: CARDB domain-containing protein [Gemmataceae bacterium]